MSLRPPDAAAMGATFIILSAALWSTAGLFAKGVASDAWTIIFWRGLFAAGVTTGWLAIRRALMPEIRRLGGPEWLATGLMAAGTAAFIPAFKLTTIANVALIYAGAPFIAAALAWAWLGEAPTRKVMAASAAAFGGVALIVLGSADAGPSGARPLLGDMLALFMTLMMAAAMVVYRRWPGTGVSMPAAASSLILVPLAALFSTPLAAPAPDIALIAGFGVVFAVASILLMAGAARLPSAEAALLSALETPLAPVWAWLILAEVPALTTMAGGAIIMTAVIASRV